MPSLSDIQWVKVGDEFVIRVPWKMVPATKILQPRSTYKIFLQDDRVYTGMFLNYCYKKLSLDSALVKVFLEFKLSNGEISIQEHDIKLTLLIESV